MTGGKGPSVATTDSFHRVYKNSAILTFLRLLEPLLAMVVVIAISRLRGLETMGGYAFVISFVAMFGTIGQMGLQVLVTREVAARKEMSDSYLSGALLLFFCSSIILAVAMNLSKGYFGLSPEVSKAVFLISLNLFPMFAISAFEAVFLGFERTDLIALQQVSGNLVRVVLSLVLIGLGFGLVPLVLAIVASSLASAAVSAYAYFRYLSKGRLAVNLEVCRRLLRASPVFLLTTLVWILWARLDVLLLTKLSGITQVAIYSAAYKLFEAAMIVPQSYVRASFPHLSALFQAKPRLFDNANADMLRDVLFYVFPAAGLIVGLAPFLVSALYGREFLLSATVLQLLMIGLIPWTAGRVFANTLVATNLQKYDLIAGICAVPVSLLLNLWLIPRMGAPAAAIASAASLSVFFCCQFIFTRRVGYRISLMRTARWPLVVGTLLFAAAWLARQGWLFAVLEGVALALALVLYFRRGENRQSLRKPLLLLQGVIRS
jgi:O-antigen/teichoic acid export membrane protein